MTTKRPGFTCEARAPPVVRSAIRAPGPTEPRSFFAGGGAGGGGGVPTVKRRFISVGCASHWYVYRPSVNVTVHVTVPTNSMSVA